MQLDSYLKLYITSTTLLVGCVGFVYLILKFNRRFRNATDALNYLTIVTVITESDCEVVIKELQRRCKVYRAVGFDCEWVTEHGKKRPVALVQLSTFDGYCGLFRLNMLRTVPNSLKELLEDKTIYKVGVAPTDDAKYLFADYGINLNSSLDIRHIAVLCGHQPGGLASLTKSLLHIILDKSWRVRCSNWEAETLSDMQVKYAAADAHVAIKIFVKLIEELNKPSIYKVLQRNKKDIWSNLDEVCLKYANYNFTMKHGNKTKDIGVNNSKRNKEVSKTYSNLTRSKPLYHNCFLQAPDGELLCTCDNKKALWYVEKQLADVVTEEPLTVRLRFEPAGRSVGEVGRYYQLTKENKCVVCGNANSYIRKNVVPREYRKYFPDIMKDHSSHDVLLLCVQCHQRSNMADQRVREQLANLCAAPLACKDSSKYVEDSMRKKVRSAARALLNLSAKLPEKRSRCLKHVLLQYYTEHTEITTELLKEAAELHVLFENTDYESHGLKVVEYFLGQEGGLLRLEEVWREHFLTIMHPQYMPELWSIKHNEERLRVKFKEGRLSEKSLKSIGVSGWH
ncbi:exonuclease 3'-5' domain-containing protein 2 [Galleria mellonella]|uniref:Exonuclease 3'-5' domain-containing protein 2 n=1 Tax=Galleria mellonella TaxID=7137 RepID=A0A6J1X8J0_GALME|nr:exonuclease 3'-5' domain-containing protein 2 [Galleria mellonella]